MDEDIEEELEDTDCGHCVILDDSDEAAVDVILDDSINEDDAAAVDCVIVTPKKISGTSERPI